MIIDTMLVYYGEGGTKACIPTASVPGENPIGVLALVCTAVGTHPYAVTSPLSYGFLQTERSSPAHTLGYFVKDGCPFSDKSWGHRTAVYLKLAKDMTATQWARFYGMLRVHEDIQDKLEEFSKPAEQWTNDPDEYIIVGSDPEE